MGWILRLNLRLADEGLVTRDIWMVGLLQIRGEHVKGLGGSGEVMRKVEWGVVT